jgi:hypothetical protein
MARRPARREAATKILQLIAINRSAHTLCLFYDDSVCYLSFVFAVILSAAKDPEEINPPKPLEPFSPEPTVYLNPSSLHSPSHRNPLI